MSRRAGFMLVELLAAAAVICVISGAALVAFSEGPDERRVVRDEAENLRSWLMSRMEEAARENCGFKLIPIFIGMQASELKLEWRGGARDLKSEFYSAERADLERVSLAKEYTFDGEWFTLTPAASFIIRSRRDSSIRLIVTASGTGYADVKETLED